MFQIIYNFVSISPILLSLQLNNKQKRKMLIIQEAKTTKQIKQFIKLPFSIYKNDPMWVPPIIKDELKQLSPETSPFFEYCDAKFWTAWENNKCVGRVGAIVNHEYNKKTSKKFGRFTRIEFINDRNVSKKLIETAEGWLREQGMEIIHGPLGFSNLEGQGMLIEGFDYLPSIASVYHKPYYKEHIEALGFEKENDWVEFRLTIGENVIDKGIRGAAIVKRRYGFEVTKPESTKELQQYVKPLFLLLNDAFQELPYTTPFNDKMIDTIAGKYFKILNPKFVRIVKKDDELVAFVVGMPSLSRAMQKANGRLFPFGIYHIMKALKKPKTIDLLLTGVAPKYHTSGAAVILFSELQQEVLNMGINQMETTGIFETNHNVISNWKNYEHIQHKRRRCFMKEIKTQNKNVK